MRGKGGRGIGVCHVALGLCQRGGGGDGVGAEAVGLTTLLPLLLMDEGL